MIRRKRTKTKRRNKQSANTSSNIESVALSVGNALESVGDNVANIRASAVSNCLTIQDECGIL